MTHVLHRLLGPSYPLADSGKGVVIRDRDGVEFIDAASSGAVSCLGHGNEAVIEAMRAQLGKLDFVHSSFFSTRVAEALGDELIAHAPIGMSHAYFVSGGSEAIEASLKMARQYFVEIGQPGRTRFVARRQSYHGNTLGALAVGGNEWRRKQFAPLLIATEHVSACYEYRGRKADESAEAYGERLAAELEEKLEALDPNTVIAFVAETVGGATLGANPPVPGYFKRIREICDRYEILLILDEVMCGMGRTGTLHACEQEGISPDLLAIAKGLGGGYAPIGAVLVRDRVFKALRDGSGLFQHGHTYVGHPLACAAALAVQQVIRRDDLLVNVRTQGARLARRLKDRFGNHHHVGDIRGRGLFMAVEFVADRGTKEPFPSELKVHGRVKQEAMARGLMVYPMGGVIDGVRGDHILLAPPFIVDATTIDMIVERLGDAIDAAIGALPLAHQSAPAKLHASL